MKLLEISHFKPSKIYWKQYGAKREEHHTPEEWAEGEISLPSQTNPQYEIGYTLDNFICEVERSQV